MYTSVQRRSITPVWIWKHCNFETTRKIYAQINEKCVCLWKVGVCSDIIEGRQKVLKVQKILLNRVKVTEFRRVAV